MFDHIDSGRVYYAVGQRSGLPGDEHWLSEPEARVLGGLKAPKRRQDWLLGRWTAKAALNRLAPLRAGSLERWQVLAAADGSPRPFLGQAPVDLCLSLSHSTGVAICALAMGGQKIGCDVEKIEKRSRSFEETFFTRSELELLEDVPAVEKDRFVSLIWSAKESVLKALLTGLRSDTRRVRIDSIESGPPGRWQQFRAQDLEAGGFFSGRWRIEAGMLYTIVSDRALSDPVELQL